MYPKIAKDRTLLNLFVPEIESNSNNLSSNSASTDFNFKMIDNFTYCIEHSNKNDVQTTALVVKKQYAILDPQVVYRFKKSIKLSIRSFLISLSLTFLNFFI